MCSPARCSDCTDPRRKEVTDRPSPSLPPLSAAAPRRSKTINRLLSWETWSGRALLPAAAGGHHCALPVPDSEEVLQFWLWCATWTTLKYGFTSGDHRTFAKVCGQFQVLFSAGEMVQHSTISPWDNCQQNLHQCSCRLLQKLLTWMSKLETTTLNTFLSWESRAWEHLRPAPHSIQCLNGSFYSP